MGKTARRLPSHCHGLGRRREAAPRAISCQRSGGVTDALLEVARWRIGLFRLRFGRDPDPNEPLFFDPTHDHPTPAADAEMCRQVIAAAQAAHVNVRLLLKNLGIIEP